MPCCVIGAMFMLQLLAVVRWFKRVILRKAPTEDEKDLWTRPKEKLRFKVKKTLSDPGRKKVFIMILAAEAILFVAVWMIGGFKIFRHGYEALSTAVEYVWTNYLNW